MPLTQNDDKVVFITTLRSQGIYSMAKIATVMCISSTNQGYISVYKTSYTIGIYLVTAFTTTIYECWCYRFRSIQKLQ